jgi:hypothetical protein
VEDLVKELLSFIEGDAKWWEDTARQCGELANNLPPDEKAKWQLLRAVYGERAQAHRELVKSVRMRQLSGN